MGRTKDLIDDLNVSQEDIEMDDIKVKVQQDISQEDQVSTEEIHAHFAIKDTDGH